MVQLVNGDVSSFVEPLGKEDLSAPFTPRLVLQLEKSFFCGVSLELLSLHECDVVSEEPLSDGNESHTESISVLACHVRREECRSTKVSTVDALHEQFVQDLSGDCDAGENINLDRRSIELHLHRAVEGPACGCRLRAPAYSRRKGNGTGNACWPPKEPRDEEVKGVTDITEETNGHEKHSLLYWTVMWKSSRIYLSFYFA
jgi:hypothetical protein